jgi:ubiquinone/menaquinone biosynthesis C-methylase UbiE
MIDKQGIIDRLRRGGTTSIELGCGNGKKNASAIGIDLLDYPGVDLVGDVFEILQALPDACVDAVYSYHFVEHIDDLERLLRELERVVRPGGTLDFVAPHFSNPYFYSDPTHRRFFGLYTFCYFTASTPFRRTVPTYGRQIAFDITDVQLGFKSASVFPVRYAFKRAVGVLFNATTWLREFYEENLCALLPCYEVRYRLRRQ